MYSARTLRRARSPISPSWSKFARAKLRPMFLKADMGITGANIAVAETGSIVIMTNEGNARLVTTLPRFTSLLSGWKS